MMPILFVGHGSPLNAIENNEFTKGWQTIAESIPKPSAILALSAHWLTEGTKVSTLESPATIHDFYGFPKALFDITYAAKGSPALAEKTLRLLDGIAAPDESWGIDHGVWSVLHVMYPDADIPVFQVSIDSQATPDVHFKIGQRLKPLRHENVLIMASGNVVHNLRLLDYAADGGFDWADAFDHYISDKIVQRDWDSVIDYKSTDRIAQLSVPTTEHFDPLLYILGASDPNDKLLIYNQKRTLGSLSMTSYVFS